MNTVDRLIVRLNEAVNSDCGDYSCPGYPSTSCVDGCRVEKHVQRILDEVRIVPTPHPVELRRLCHRAKQILGKHPPLKDDTDLLKQLFGEENVR